MKYNLRFFDDVDLNDARCFASFRSSHVPSVGSLVCITEDGYTYKVKRRLFVYEKDIRNKKDDCASVEIYVEQVDI
jgi:hypothetical protein